MKNIEWVRLTEVLWMWVELEEKLNQTSQKSILPRGREVERNDYETK